MSGIITYVGNTVVKTPRNFSELEIAQHFLLHPNPYIIPIVRVCWSKGNYAMMKGKQVNIRTEGLEQWLEHLYKFFKKTGYSHEDIHVGENTGKSNIVIVGPQFRLIDLESVVLQNGPSFRCWATIDRLVSLIRRNTPTNSDASLDA